MASSKPRPPVRGLTSSTAGRPLQQPDSNTANHPDGELAKQHDSSTSEQEAVKASDPKDSVTAKPLEVVTEEPLAVETVKTNDSGTVKPDAVVTSVKKTLYFSQDDVDLLDNLQLVERRRRGKRVTLSELVTEAIKDYAERHGVKTA